MMVKPPHAQPLLQLIQTMTKSEKRSFKIYFGKSNDPTEAKFIRLFDVLEAMEQYDEEAIFVKMPDLKRSQLAKPKGAPLQANLADDAPQPLKNRCGHTAEAKPGLRALAV